MRVSPLGWVMGSGRERPGRPVAESRHRSELGDVGDVPNAFEPLARLLPALSAAHLDSPW